MSTTQTAGEPRPATPITERTPKRPIRDLTQYGWDYCRERPDVVALWCFGLGFILGWKLRR